MCDSIDPVAPSGLTRRRFVKGSAVVLITAVAAESIMLLSACAPAEEPAPEPEASALDQVMAALGGQQAIEGLAGFSYKTAGTRGLILEALRPESDPVERTIFATTVSHDLAADALRLDIHRDLDFLGVQTTQDLSEIIAGDQGVVQGVQLLRGGPDLTGMLPERLAAIRAEQRLLNPVILIKAVAADPSIATDGGTETVDGAEHSKLVVETDVAPVTVFVDVDSGDITKLATMENDLLRRDTPLEILFSGWESVGELRFPGRVSLVLGGQTLMEETRTEVQVDPAFAADVFALPATEIPPFDADAAERGRKTSQYFQMFAAVGLPREGDQTTVEATELAPGVFHLTGGSHNSMVVEQENGVVIAEAPLNEARSLALLAWIKEKFPNKPVTHAAAASHHHVDHSGGLRAFAAEGSSVVVHQTVEEFWKGAFAAPSTVLPDTLSSSGKTVALQLVPEEGKLTLPDPVRPVTIYHVPSEHAADVVAIVADKEGILFVSDIYTPSPDATASPGTAELAAAIDAQGIDVKQIAGGHGGVATIKEFRALKPAAAPAAFIRQIDCPCQLHSV